MAQVSKILTHGKQVAKCIEIKAWISDYITSPYSYFSDS